MCTSFEDKVEVEKESFASHSDLTSVEVPSNIVRIGELAFSSCLNLRSVTLPDTLKEIGDRAFFGCANLEAINIPKDLVRIGENAFYGCDSIKEIMIPSLIHIEKRRVFFGSSVLLSLEIPSSVIKMNNRSFYEVDHYKFIIPQNIISIGDNTFRCCDFLDEIIVPEWVKSIGEYAFSGCMNLKNIKLSSNLVSIGEGAFLACNQMETIIIPESILQIKDYTFAFCSSLKSIFIPRITQVSNNAFLYCSDNLNFYEIKKKIPVKITLLGTGASKGIPELCCNCNVCNSSNPYDKRTRTSAIINFENKNLLIDCSPDLRTHCLREKIYHIDGVLITHIHSDHIFGIDELRAFSNSANNNATGLPVYSLKCFNDKIREYFDYIFKPAKQVAGGKPKITLNDISNVFNCLGINIKVIPVIHGSLQIIGFRFYSFAYITDCSFIPNESYELLYGIETLIINAQSDKPKKSHFDIYQTIDEIAKIHPKRAFLIHISHSLSHCKIKEIIESFKSTRHDLQGISIEPGYDGLVIDNLYA